MANHIRWAQFEELIADPSDDCIIWPYGCSNKYPRATHPGLRIQVYLHSEACAQRCGPRPDGLMAAHLCGVKRCINPRHLRWATSSENHADMHTLGEVALGQQRKNTILSEDQVRQIRSDRARGIRLKVIADEFGVSVQAVCDITHRRNWKWVD